MVPMNLLALEQTDLIWEVKERLLLIKTPRYLYESTLSISELPMVSYVVVKVW